MLKTSLIELLVNGDRINIKPFTAADTNEHLHQQAVNIFASGPSINSVNFSTDLLHAPSFFVNGSIALTKLYDFSNIAAYVISDPRFIRHQPQLIDQHYQGQPLYATLAVFEALADHHPQLLKQHHRVMRLIYPADRASNIKPAKSWFSKLPFAHKWIHPKRPLSQLAFDPNFVIDSKYQPQAIGVSLDVSHGFIEAGTVAFVAAQLAFSRGASMIHLFGLDLINSRQPRFYEDARNSAPSKLDKAVSDRIVPSFDLLSRVYRDHGVSVVNHSPISKDLFDALIGADTHNSG